MKEISYLHAEALRRRAKMTTAPSTLIDEIPRGGHRDEEPRLRQGGVNLQESGPRRTCIIAVATEGDEEIAKHANHVIYVPKVRDAFSPVTASARSCSRAPWPRQTRLRRGCAHKSRGKSVTVE